MVDEEVVSGNEPAGNEQYIAAIKELKENSVSKEEFLKVKKENKQLLDTLVSGQTIEQPVTENKKTIQELKDRLMTDGISNLDYVITSLELRNRVLEDEGRDLYCPEGAQYNPTLQDRETAKRVAETLQEMVDVADGSPEVFNSEFQRRTQDIVIPRRK